MSEVLCVMSLGGFNAAFLFQSMRSGHEEVEKMLYKKVHWYEG